MDFAMFLLRVVVGGLFVGHGAQKLFGWFGGHGPDATGKFFSKLGYRPGRRHALVAGTVEAGAGLMLIAGLLVPFAAAAVIGVMVNAIGAVHADEGLWSSQGGYEYPLVLIVIATVLAIAGPGGAAVDNVGGAWWGLLAVLLGVGSGLVMLAARERTLEAVGEDSEDSSDAGDERQAA